MNNEEYERQRSEMWATFARDQATKIMVVVEPVYYGLTDQRHIGSPEANNQDRLDREHEAMAAIVREALEQFAFESGFTKDSVVTQSYIPQDRQGAGQLVSSGKFFR